MSRDSKNSSKTEARSELLNRPFTQAILRRAERFVCDYRITLERNENVGFSGVFADAKTPEQCFSATQKALTVAVATMIECGQVPPQPASARKRTEQVNVRLTAEEKTLLANAASSFGFKGLSDFLRNIALNRVLSAR